MAESQKPIELTKTLQKVNIPSFVADRNGMVTWLNDAAIKTFGDLVGQPVTTFMAPEHVSLARRQLERKLRGTPVTDYEVEILTRDGRRRRVEISSVPIAGGDECHAVFGGAVTRKARGPSLRAANLTLRQMDVLQLLGEGASTDQIAAALHLSKETVRNHIRHILRALGAHSRLEAVALAHRQGLLHDDAT